MIEKVTPKSVTIFADNTINVCISLVHPHGYTVKIKSARIVDQFRMMAVTRPVSDTRD